MANFYTLPIAQTGFRASGEIDMQTLLDCAR